LAFAALALCALGARPLPALAGDSPEERLFPSDGFDVVVLEDERVLRCKVLEQGKDAWTLEFPAGKVTIPRKGVEVRWFKDYDPVPHAPGEKTLADKGMVRFAGQWVTAAFAAERRTKEIDRIRQERAEDAAHGAWASRWKVPTEHFRVESNLPRKRVAEYGVLLEEFCKTVKDGLALAIPKEPLPVYIFRTRKEFKDFAKSENSGLTEHVVGFYRPPYKGGREYLALFDFRDDPEDTLDTLLHEATHWIIRHGSTADVPMWLNEGLAEYFGGSTYRYKKFQAGGIQDARLLWFLDMVEQGTLIPLDDLTSDDGSKREKFGLDHYAESWLFCHFLLHARQGSYRGAFRDSVRGLVRDCRDQLLHRMERKDFKKITEEMTAYAKTLGEKLPLGPAYAERGLRRLTDENIKGAEADFRRALDAKDKDPQTFRAVALGYYMMEGMQKEAAELLRKVLEAEPLDARSRSRLVLLVPEEEGLLEARLAACLAPDDAEILGNLARFLAKDSLGPSFRIVDDAQRTRAGEALAMATRAAEAGGGEDDVLTAILLSFSIGEFPDAAKHIETGLRADADNPLLVGLLAAARTLDGKPDAFAAILGPARTRWLAAPRTGAMSEGLAPVRRKRPSVGERRWFMAVTVASKACHSWDATKAAAEGLQKIYVARPPSTPQEWSNYAGMLMEGGLTEQATLALEEARRRFPDDNILDSLPDELMLEGDEPQEGE
jgi:tetratricopeptide (TPR) repeat protein